MFCTFLIFALQKVETRISSPTLFKILNSPFALTGVPWPKESDFDISQAVYRIRRIHGPSLLKVLISPVTLTGGVGEAAGGSGLVRAPPQVGETGLLQNVYVLNNFVLVGSGLNRFKIPPKLKLLSHYFLTKVKINISIIFTFITK